jgi:hypothetical protein
MKVKCTPKKMLELLEMKAIRCANDNREVQRGREVEQRTRRRRQ